MSAMWQHGEQGTATGPTIITDSGAQVFAYWSDADGVRLDVGGTLEDMTPDDARALAAALAQLADMPGPS